MERAGKQHGTDLSRRHVRKEADMRVGEIHIPLQYYIDARKGSMVGRTMSTSAYGWTAIANMAFLEAQSVVAMMFQYNYEPLITSWISGTSNTSLSFSASLVRRWIRTVERLGARLRVPLGVAALPSEWVIL